MLEKLESDVIVAFEVLLEEIEAVVSSLNKTGVEAFVKGEYRLAKELTKKGMMLAAFREKVQNLQKEWKHLIDSSTRTKRAPKERLKKGMRTPEDFFREPILMVLFELGGSAPVAEVLDEVYKRVKSSLNEYDMQPLPSNTKDIRWRNTAKWCRKAMVIEGLLRSDSPRGIWELSEEGTKQAIMLTKTDKEIM